MLDVGPRDVLSNTSTMWAPRSEIPADARPDAGVGATGTLTHTLIEFDPRFPTVSTEVRAAPQATGVALEARAPDGIAPDPMDVGSPTVAVEKSARKARKGSRA